MDETSTLLGAEGADEDAEEFPHGEPEPGAGEGDTVTLAEGSTEAATAPEAISEFQRQLRSLGWPLQLDGLPGDQTFEAVREFQRGFAFWDLLVDGRVGPKTREALSYAVQHEGRCGPHFTFREFKSRGNGWIRLSRELVRGLEAYRELIEAPVQIRSGYRDPKYNAEVGGKPASQHLYGNAVDLAQHRASVEAVRRLERFSGIGIVKATGRVLHLDVRHAGPNTTGGTPRNPTIWFYR